MEEKNIYVLFGLGIGIMLTTVILGVFPYLGDFFSTFNEWNRIVLVYVLIFLVGFILFVFGLFDWIKQDAE